MMWALWPPQLSFATWTTATTLDIKWLSVVGTQSSATTTAYPLWLTDHRSRHFVVNRIVSPYVRRPDNENWRARAEEIAFARGDYHALTADQRREIEHQARRMSDRDFEQLIGRNDELDRRRFPIDRRDEDAQKAQKAAAARARELLLSFLTTDQRTEFEATNAISVVIDGRRYKINRGKVANIEVYDNDNLLHRLCIHPDGYNEMPSEDVMLSQLLHLRDDARGFLQRANVHPLTLSVASLEQIAAAQQRTLRRMAA